MGPGVIKNFHPTGRFMWRSRGVRETIFTFSDTRLVVFAGGAMVWLLKRKVSPIMVWSRTRNMSKNFGSKSDLLKSYFETLLLKNVDSI